MKIEIIEDIDSLLREECDLGYIVDYLDSREDSPNKFLILPAIDTLRFIPQFNDKVNILRNQFSITPQKLNKELEKLLGKFVYSNYVSNTERFARGLYFPDLNMADKLVATGNRIKIWESDKYPKISREVGKLRIVVLGKLSEMWHEAIKNYILYDYISPSPITFRKQPPYLEQGSDPITLEPYIGIKVYSHTDISIFKHKLWLENIQKKLPNYFNPKRRSEDSFLNRFLYFVLKRYAGLSHKQTETWLKSKKLLGFPQVKSSREVKRFLELFTSI